MATILICNDAWHPSVPLLAGLQGTNLMIIPTNSSKYGSNRETWSLLSRYYAIIYESYVVFVNRSGQEDSWDFWGGSELISPTGEVLVRAGSDEEICYADISISEVNKVRESLPIMQEEDPILTHRLLEIYIANRHSVNKEGSNECL